MSEAAPHEEEKRIAIRSRVITPVVFIPQNVQEGMELAEYLAKSDLVPKEMRDKPANVFLAMQRGAAVGLSPLVALESIAVINGRAGMWGDALLGVVYDSGILVDIEEPYDKSTKTATCIVTRKGMKPYPFEFSWEEAEQVVQTSYQNGNKILRRLVDKETYRSYPKRMLQMRARGFALRDRFPDVLKGLRTREELEDLAFLEGTDEKVVEGRRVDNELMPKPKTETPPIIVRPERVDPPADAVVPNRTEPRPMTADEFVEGLSPTKAATEPAADVTQPSLPVDPPTSTSTSTPAQASPALITEDARRRLFAEMKKVNKTVGDLKVYLQAEHKIDSTKAIPVSTYDAVLKWCQTKPAREPGQEG